MQYFNNSHPQRYYFLPRSVPTLSIPPPTTDGILASLACCCHLSPWSKGRPPPSLWNFHSTLLRPSSPPPHPSDIRCRNSLSYVSVYVYALWKFHIKFMTHQTVLRSRNYVNASTDLRSKMKLKSAEQLFISSIYGRNWKETRKIFHGMR